MAVQLTFPRRRSLIFTDRLALVLFVILLGLAALYAFGGLEFNIPTTEVFRMLAEGAFYFCLAIVALGRLLRFMIWG